jgi:Cdc6-like AAA superfamily ATPase
LDDLDFLLKTDGNDLLYFLSRLKNTAKLHLISISANHPTLSHVVDERTYSRLRPHRLPFASYTEDQAFEILEKRSQKALSGIDIDLEALTAITTWTTNIRLGLLWIVKAAKTVDNIITINTVNAVRHAAADHYRALLLRDFTPHHSLLLDVITQLTDDGTTAATGTVYEQYTALCRTIGLPPLTLRRISDFLTHLELLHLIDVDHHAGGKHGKTRDIRLTPLQQL